MLHKHHRESYTRSPTPTPHLLHAPVLEEKAAARDNLRRCLVRKRVAFRLYRQWYWESFDDDMQVCVVRECACGGAGSGVRTHARTQAGWLAV